MIGNCIGEHVILRENLLYPFTNQILDIPSTHKKPDGEMHGLRLITHKRLIELVHSQSNFENFSKQYQRFPIS